MSTAQLEVSMGSGEFTRWAAYFELHPDASPEARELKADYRMAILAYTTANKGRTRKDKEIPFDKFLPKWRQTESEPDTPEALAAKVEALRAIFTRKKPVIGSKKR